MFFKFNLASLIIFTRSSSHCSQKAPYTFSDVLNFTRVSQICFFFRLLPWIQGRSWVDPVYLLLFFRQYLFIYIFFNFFFCISLFQFVNEIVENSFAEAQNATCTLVCVVAQDSKQIRKVISVKVVFKL